MDSQPAGPPQRRAAPPLADGEIDDLVRRLIPDAELAPGSVDEVAALPTFADALRVCAETLGTPYSEVEHRVQDALVLRRLRQLVTIARANPLWRDRLDEAGTAVAPATYETWQQIPLSDKDVQRDFFMGARPGVVVPLDRGGFEIVASGGSSDGRPVETVYALRELHDTYRIAGHFLGTYLLPRYLTGSGPKWLFTTLADYQMWSSGTMVGGVLQHAPGVNYIGAGPVSHGVLQHMFSYPGPKALMGISAGIAYLTELGAGMSRQDRDSFRVALYGSGVLAHRKRAELKAFYPQVTILSYFAATQAETIGLQLAEESADLTAVPGLHLIEIVRPDGTWVAEGEEGELVVTRLHGPEAPVLRLRLGDRMIRRPALDGPGLKAQQFEFAGRVGDVLHLNDTQYSAPGAYAALCEALRTANVVDLATVAHEVQFANYREGRLVTLTAAVDDTAGLTYRINSVLGPYGVQRVFADALPRALSVFNQLEADAAAIDRSGYRFEIRFVPPASPEIERTDVGKVPLVRDRC